VAMMRSPPPHGQLFALVVAGSGCHNGDSTAPKSAILSIPEGLWDRQWSFRHRIFISFDWPTHVEGAPAISSRANGRDDAERPGSLPGPAWQFDSSGHVVDREARIDSLLLAFDQGRFSFSRSQRRQPPVLEPIRRVTQCTKPRLRSDSGATDSAVLGCDS
jgi:hypothetical protein